MLRVAVTGGVATGKSTFCQFFLHFCPDYAFFDCDREAKRVLEEEKEIIAEVIALFGNEILSGDGSINRAEVRRRVFSDSSQRRRLESLLHPPILQACRRMAEESQNKGKKIFVADVPLLFEANYAGDFDHTITVACSETTQTERLQARDHQSPEEAQQMILAQAPLKEKIAKSNHVIWNDFSLPLLREQAALLQKKLFVT